MRKIKLILSQLSLYFDEIKGYIYYFILEHLICMFIHNKIIFLIISYISS